MASRSPPCVTWGSTAQNRGNTHESPQPRANMRNHETYKNQAKSAIIRIVKNAISEWLKKEEVLKRIKNYRVKTQLFFIKKAKSLWSSLKLRSILLFKKITVYLYKSYTGIIGIHNKTRRYLENGFSNSPFSRICIYVFLAFCSVFIAGYLKKLGVVISADALSGLAASIGSVIGGTIAIVFTLSTFILQSTSDLFSTQYLNKFINNNSERRVFLALAIFSILSFIISFITDFSAVHQQLFSILIFVVSCSFYLIYILYKDLRRMINPETTLTKIRDNAVKELGKIKKSFSLSAKLQGFIYSYDDYKKSMLLETQYTLYPVWKENMLIYVKQLYEIALRLLAKNEIETTKLAVKFIHDIYAENLKLRNGSFVKTPAFTLPVVYTFDDQGFTTAILEYLESYANRILQENRKENIQHLLQVYQSMFISSLEVKFAETRISDNTNPIGTLVLGYYSGFAENIIATKDVNSIWEMEKATSNIQKIILQKNNDPFLLETVDSIFGKLSKFFIENKDIQGRSSFTDELVQILLNRIILSWDKYSNDVIFWKRLFENLKKHLLVSSLLTQRTLDLSLSNILIHFREWQTKLVNAIFEIKDKVERKKKLDSYLIFMQNWSDFLLDFSRDFGINANPLCLQTIFSVEQNTNIINFLEDKTKQKLDKLYKTQFNTLSWYLHNTTTIDNYHSVELTNLLRFLIWEIVQNLENKIKPDLTNDIIDLYISIIDGLFGKVKDSYGFDLPRIAVKLVPLGVVLSKYTHNFEQKVLDKIKDLNDRYLKKHEEPWKEEIKKFGKKVTRPDEYQLCFEISELKDDVFSYNAVRFDIEQILNQNITEEQWQKFVDKIEYCKGVEYSKTSIF